MSVSDDSAIRAGDKTPKEVNRQNREFWEAQSKKLKRQLRKWPNLAQLAAEEIQDRARFGGIRTAPSVEYVVSKLIKQLGVAGKLTPRERKIWIVIQHGANGMTYCRELENAGIRPPRSGIWKDCAAGTYPAAFRLGGRWPHRIQLEKSKIKAKAELACE